MQENIIHRARGGDQRAFQQLLEEYNDIVWRTARVLLPDAVAAEDAIQEAWVDTWRSLARFREGQPFRPWLLTIVANRCRMSPRIILLAVGMFALGTDAFIIAGVLPAIAQETGVTEGMVGQLITVFSLTYGLGAPILAAATAHWPRNRVLVGALGLLGLANLASALSPSFPLLLLTRILAGCFAATYTPLAFAVGIELAPPAKRGRRLRWSSAG